MKKRIIKALSLLICLLMTVSCFSVFASAEKISYSTGAAGVSDAYKNSKYYKNLTSQKLYYSPNSCKH